MMLQQTETPRSSNDIHAYGRRNESTLHTMISFDNRSFRGAGLEAISSPEASPVKQSIKPQRSPSSPSKWFATMIQNELIKSLHNLETEEGDEGDDPVRDSVPTACHESENCFHGPTPHHPYNLSSPETTCSSCDLPESEMTIEQLQHFVIKQMPFSIQRKVPAEAWNRIFGSGATKKNTLENKSTAVDLALRRSYSYNVSSRFDEEKTEEPQSPARKTSVSFGLVQVRYYERSIGVNPSVARGPAVGLGWAYNFGGEVPVDEWEANYVKTRGTRALLLSRDARIELLLDLGYTQEEIAEVTRTILKARNERAMTAQNLNVQEMEDAVETASRLLK
jgi:hypothetical protein